MDDRRAPLWLACYALAAAVAVVVRLPPAPAALCTAPLVLLAPGLALVLALGIAGEREHPGRRLAVAVALSMATTALGGLLVNAATELTTTSWTVSLAGWTVACSLVAFLKAPPRATRSSTKRPREWAAGRRVWTQALACVLALMLLGGAAALSERNSRSAYDKPVTQLSLLPAPGARGRALRLTVANLTPRTERMILTVFEGRRRTTRRLLSVRASQLWTSEEPVASARLRAALTRPGHSTAFSEVAWRAALPAASPRKPVAKRPRKRGARTPAHAAAAERGRHGSGRCGRRAATGAAGDTTGARGCRR